MSEKLYSQLESVCERMNGEFKEDARPRTKADEPVRQCDFGDAKLQVREDLPKAKLITENAEAVIKDPENITASHVGEQTVNVRGEASTDLIDNKLTVKDAMNWEG